MCLANALLMFIFYIKLFRSIVLASLHYTSNSVVDVDQIQRRLSGNYSAAAIATEQTTAQVFFLW